MKPFNNIKQAKYYIGELAKSIASAKSEKQEAFYTKMVETFIAIVNDNMLLAKQNLKSDVMDSLILARMYDQLQEQERKSMNYSQNMYVVERDEAGKLNYVGTIDIDLFVQTNYELSKKPEGTIYNVAIKSKDGNSYGKLNAQSSAELSDAFYGQKVEGIFIDDIIKNIDEDIKYDKELNLEKVVSFLASKELSLVSQKENANVETQKETFKVLVMDLVEQFKTNMQWSH